MKLSDRPKDMSTWMRWVEKAVRRIDLRIGSVTSSRISSTDITDLVTPSADWTILALHAARDNVTSIVGQALYSGSTVTGDSTGGITDVPIFTGLPEEFWPPAIAPAILSAPSGGSFGNIIISTSGACTWQAFHATATLVNSQNVRFAVAYPSIPMPI